MRALFQIPFLIRYMRRATVPSKRLKKRLVSDISLMKVSSPFLRFDQSFRGRLRIITHIFWIVHLQTYVAVYQKKCRMVRPSSLTLWSRSPQVVLFALASQHVTASQSVCQKSIEMGLKRFCFSAKSVEKRRVCLRSLRTFHDNSMDIFVQQSWICSDAVSLYSRVQDMHGSKTEYELVPKTFYADCSGSKLSLY